LVAQRAHLWAIPNALPRLLVGHTTVEAITAALSEAVEEAAAVLCRSFQIKADRLRDHRGGGRTGGKRTMKVIADRLQKNSSPPRRRRRKPRPCGKVRWHLPVSYILPQSQPEVLRPNFTFFRRSLHGDEGAIRLLHKSRGSSWSWRRTSKCPSQCHSPTNECPT
jgi:hypothetical protein